MSLLWVTKGDEKQQGERGMMKSEKWADIIYGRSQGRRNVHDWFLLLLCKSSIWFTEQHIFKIIIYSFNTCATNFVISFEVYDGFISGSKNFEAMKGGKLTIQTWLSCPFSEHRLLDLPSSVDGPLRVFTSSFTFSTFLFIPKVGNLRELFLTFVSFPNQAK